jgi:hypothetical protein
MTYGVVIDVPAPVETYDAVHAELMRRITGPLEGFLCHIGRPTATGFQVIEVWETKEQCDRYNAEFVAPAMQELFGDQAPPQEPAAEEFEPRGLIIPSAAVMV